MSALLDRRLYRRLPETDTGPVYTFDIDKTYLDTHLSHARDLLRIPLELAIDKRPYAGVAELIRACQRGSDAVGPDRPAFFVSASPRQMRPVLERRMELDELAVDGLTLKSWGHYLRRGRFGGLTQQVPYKLTALLATRAELPPSCEEVLFGDDSEADSLIYSLYSAIVSRALPSAELDRELEKHDVGRSERAALVETVTSLESLFARVAERTRRPVRHIFIHGVRRSEPQLVVCERGVRPIRYHSPLYPASYLFRDGLIGGTALKNIYRAVRAANAFTAAEARELVEPILAAADPNWRENLFGGDWQSA